MTIGLVGSCSCIRYSDLTTHIIPDHWSWWLKLPGLAVENTLRASDCLPYSRAVRYAMALVKSGKTKLSWMIISTKDLLVDKRDSGIISSYQLTHGTALLTNTIIILFFRKNSSRYIAHSSSLLWNKLRQCSWLKSCMSHLLSILLYLPG